jgi:hypothetical protein
MAKAYCNILQYMSTVSQYVLPWNIITGKIPKQTKKFICTLNVVLHLVKYASHDACRL